MTENPLSVTGQQPAATAAAEPVAATPQNPLLRTADFAFVAADIDSRVDRRLAESLAKLTLPGFRRGRVPMSVMRRRYGRDTLHDVLERVTAMEIQKLLQQAQTESTGLPHVELPDVAVDGKYKVRCYYEVMPDIADPDLTGQTLQKPTFTVTEEAAAEMIEILRAQNGRYVRVDEPSGGTGYRLWVNFASKLLTESGEEGETLEAGENRPLYPAAPGMAPELRDKVAGAKAGDTVQADIRLGEGEDVLKELRGRMTRMTVHVLHVEKLEKAELTPAFFRAFREECDTLEAFQAAVLAHLQRESGVRLRNFLHARAMALMVKCTPPFALPQNMIVRECHRLLQAAQLNWREQGMADSAAQLTADMFLPEAQRRVMVGLVLSAWRKRHNIKIEKDDVEARLREIAETYEEPTEALKEMRASKAEMEAMKVSVLEDYATEWVSEQCECVEAPMTLADFLNVGAQRI